MLDPAAVGTTIGPVRRRWTSTDALVYALGVGAGAADPLDELEFTTENTRHAPQRVLPTFATVLGPMGSAFDGLGSFDRSRLVHAGQSVQLHREIPVEGEADVVTEITGVFDKGTGALAIAETRATLVGTGEALFTSTAHGFVRGAGGWGGERGPSPVAWTPPTRVPDDLTAAQTRPDQALLYRLSGDRNPLHADPSYAARAGFARPILHGLCTYGFTGRLLLHRLCGSEPKRFLGMEGRFSAPVVPGETLTVQVWMEHDGAASFRTVGDDGRTVVDGGRIGYRP